MLCLLLKSLLVLHRKLALYYVQQSGAVSQRSVQTCLPHTVNMPQFLNSKILSKQWESLIIYFGNLSTNLMLFQSRTIGYSSLFNVLRIFYARERALSLCGTLFKIFEFKN
jgi:hypothetical protein